MVGWRHQEPSETPRLASASALCLRPATGQGNHDGFAPNKSSPAPSFAMARSPLSSHAPRPAPSFPPTPTAAYRSATCSGWLLRPPWCISCQRYPTSRRARPPPPLVWTC